MTERSATLDDATMKVGLLMESAQAHQKLAEGQLERLRAHTQDLDSVVRDEIRRTLVEELRALTAEAARATQALQKIRGAGVLRGAAWSLAVALLCTVLPIGVARWALPSAAEIATLRSRRDELAASLASSSSKGAVSIGAAAETLGAFVSAWTARRLLMATKATTSLSKGINCMNPVALTVVLTLSIALGVRRFTRGVQQRGREFHKRGVLIADGAAMQRRSARRKKARSDLLTLAGVAIPPGDECKHFKLIGTTGTGKTTAIRELLGSAIARGDRAVFADPDARISAAFLQSLSRRHRSQPVRIAIREVGSVCGN